ncbi:MAG: ankyrin repeat domain-containing protein [Chitinophagales bacterium]
MDNSNIKDPLFRKAVDAIDAGDIISLQNLLEESPTLVNTRLDTRDEGYFKNPYLLWFVADNPIRHEKLPANICDVTRLIIKFVKQNAPDSFHEQIEYTLGLVSTGRIPRQSGVQIEWIDLLIDAGATPGNGIGALAHGNVDAARHLIERGGTLTLTTAICLNRKEDIMRLSAEATKEDKQIALMAAAFYGNPQMIEFLLNTGVDVNAYIDGSSGFHSHATALHQAVFSGSLDSVKLLVHAGANPGLKDRVYDGTPLEWASHMQTEEKDQAMNKKYEAIESYLTGR